MAMAQRWDTALREHTEILSAYIARVRATSDEQWRTHMPGRTWSPAVETLHLIKAYELPLNGSGMRLRVSPAYAWILRNVYLRWLIARRTFHHGAKAPSEVRPDEEMALAVSKAELIDRLESTSNAAVEALRAAGQTRPDFRMIHAYFGPMTPLLSLRMLSAHTRHHLG